LWHEGRIEGVEGSGGVEKHIGVMVGVIELDDFSRSGGCFYFFIVGESGTSLIDILIFLFLIELLLHLKYVVIERGCLDI
jgi:hypothetical protein